LSFNSPKSIRGLNALTKGPQGEGSGRRGGGEVAGKRRDEAAAGKEGRPQGKEGRRVSLGKKRKEEVIGEEGSGIDEEWEQGRKEGEDKARPQGRGVTVLE